MKTYRALVGILSVLVVVLAYLAWSGHNKPAEQTAKEMWYTNTVERWHTNTVEKSPADAMQISRSTTLVQPVTNTLVQTVTNEVIKEVPAKFSALEKRAASVGYKYLNAPSLENGSDALYKAGPIAVEVNVGAGAASVVTEKPEAIKSRMEAALRSRNIPVAEKGSYHLKLNLNRPWATDSPGVSLISSRLELRENVAAQRQSDVVACSGIVWSTSTSKLVRTFRGADEMDACIQEPLDKFCNEYLKAKEGEKTVEARIPAFPNDFLAEGK
jgi:hypothetical protein